MTESETTSRLPDSSTDPLPASLPPLPPLTPGARRVLDAASRLFYEQGIHAVGVDTIAAEAGVTKKTLYDRFGSKEALVVSYLQHRDQRWREHIAAHLALVPEPGPDRVLAVFDATILWVPDNDRKGCSAINARAEMGDGSDGNPALPEVVRQKAWMFELFGALCREAGVDDPDGTARLLMLLHEGGLVTLGMRTFAEPFVVARAAAAEVLRARGL
ncbi:TetR/AcrR family transcriptional regulator [Frigoribacterium sp. Leaf263]|uniref:TetR/AcrR family transcriptional regulator n=1 Tax=Frigoribacterium sp. Leaf263 TaxID=1736313 RepID=UPI000A62B2A1|nr:TetR/AcrR family transcriptional regulator [Frigoribacterium sp. Leaf263]